MLLSFASVVLSETLFDISKQSSSFSHHVLINSGHWLLALKTHLRQSVFDSLLFCELGIFSLRCLLFLIFLKFGCSFLLLFLDFLSFLGLNFSL
jgi:hypothetical protein